MQEAGLQASLMKERQGAVAGQAVERRPPAGRKLGLFPHSWLPGPSCKPRGAHTGRRPGMEHDAEGRSVAHERCF